MSKRAARTQNNAEWPSPPAPKKKLRTFDEYIDLYDSEEEESPPPREIARLSWRMDPEESLSDWTIQVLATDSDQTTTTTTTEYNVHKNILAVGGKKCDYFERLFCGTAAHFSESKDATSKIKLHPLAADAFPVFLDYLYDSTTDQLSITTENATALHYLGQYFGNHRLRWDAEQFWRDDMSVSNIETYYDHAKIFRVEKISRAVTGMCTNSHQNISRDSPIIKKSDPQLWLAVLSATQERNLHLSKLIARFCLQCAEGGLDYGSFRELTTEQNLPVIASKAALELLAVEGRLLKETQNNPNLGNDNNNNNNGMTELQQRCMACLRGKWHKIELSDTHWQNDVLPHLQPTVLAKLLQNCQEQTKSLHNRQKGMVYDEDIFEEISQLEQRERRHERI